MGRAAVQNIPADLCSICRPSYIQISDVHTSHTTKISSELNAPSFHKQHSAADAEWKRIQKNTFTRWANEHLKQANKQIDDLQTDLGDGLKLIALLEVLSGKRLPRHNKKPVFRTQKLENVTIALKFLEMEVRTAQSG